MGVLYGSIALKNYLSHRSSLLDHQLFVFVAFSVWFVSCSVSVSVESLQAVELAPVEVLRGIALRLCDSRSMELCLFCLLVRFGEDKPLRSHYKVR